MKTKRSALFSVLAFCLAAVSTADAGAGGIIFGMTMPEWNPDFMPKASQVRLVRIGGTGYGVDSDGSIIGGFGFVIMDQDIMSSDMQIILSSDFKPLIGGIGGLVSGVRLGSGSYAHLDLAVRLGAGGLAYARGARQGWAVAYAEPFAELGVRLNSWMRLTAGLGYQFLANIAPETPFKAIVVNSPTITIGVSFGAF